MTIRAGSPEIGDEEIRAATEVLRSGFLVQAARVREFERRVAAYLGVEHAVAVSSGTAALHLAVLALGIGGGDEVIVPDYTFPACANVVLRAGAVPVLVDVSLSTFNVDVAALERAWTPRAKAIMPVHLFGLSADMDPVLAFAESHGLRVIEDAACALGATYRGRKCGAMGDLACFSFHPRKVITTGEGGMVTTNDAALAERVACLRNHGQVVEDGRVRFVEAGLNYRMTDIQGAVGVAQMDRLDGILARRGALAARYHAALDGVRGVTRPVVPDGSSSVWQSYVVLLDDGIDRSALQARLRERGIETTIGTYAVSAQPHYAGAGRPLPNALRAQERSLSLPMHTRLADADVDAVAAALREILA